MTASMTNHGATGNEDPFRWLVLRTKSKQERLAVSHLEERGVEPYCPMLLEPRWHRRAPRGPVPLFPGYVFVRCDIDRHLNAVRYCPGVLVPVRFGKELATVEASLIEELKLREGERGYMVPEDFSTEIPKGERVRVVSGPLKGFEGEFFGYLRGGQRARILVEFLRSTRTVEVDPGVLKVVNR